MAETKRLNGRIAFRILGGLEFRSQSINADCVMDSRTPRLQLESEWLEVRLSRIA
jgi:hypothetical protein